MGQIWPVAYLCTACRLSDFLPFSIVEKIKRRIIFHDKWKWFEIHISVSINTVLLARGLGCLSPCGLWLVSCNKGRAEQTWQRTSARQPFPEKVPMQALGPPRIITSGCGLDIEGPGTSLVVQWLGLWDFAAEGKGPIPGWGTKIPQAVQNGQIIIITTHKF